MPEPALTKDACRLQIEHLFTPNTTPHSDLIGVEIEGLPYRASGGKISAVSLDSLPEPGRGIQYEPGGQIEIITDPCRTFEELAADISGRQTALSETLDKIGVSIARVGTNPWFDVHQTPVQLHSQRYQAMQRFFDRIGPFGRQMMVLTCGMHVNLDLGSDPIIRCKRIAAANLLVPFATALFANSRVIAGTTTSDASCRSRIWQGADPSRTGILNLKAAILTWSMDDIVEAYLDFALDAPVMCILTDSDPLVLPHTIRFRDWLEQPIADRLPTREDLLRHLSLLFPEVRPRGYIEIRTPDSPPVEWQLIPPLFYVGLLYQPSTLDAALSVLTPLLGRIDALWAKAIQAYNDSEVADVASQLASLALSGLVRLPRSMVSADHVDLMEKFIDTFPSQRRCFSDDTDLYFRMFSDN